MSCSFYIVATQKRLYQKCYFKNGGSSKRCLLNGVHTAVSKLCKTFCVFIFIMLFLFCCKNRKNVLQKKIKDWTFDAYSLTKKSSSWFLLIASLKMTCARSYAWFLNFYQTEKEYFLRHVLFKPSKIIMTCPKSVKGKK